MSPYVPSRSSFGNDLFPFWGRYGRSNFSDLWEESATTITIIPMDR
jgi:hypothetical protein